MEVARLIARVVGFNGEIDTDSAKPDGTPRKLMVCGWIALILTGMMPTLLMNLSKKVKKSVSCLLTCTSEVYQPSGIR